MLSTEAPTASVKSRKFGVLANAYFPILSIWLTIVILLILESLNALSSMVFKEIGRVSESSGFSWDIPAFPVSISGVSGTGTSMEPVSISPAIGCAIISLILEFE